MNNLTFFTFRYFILAFLSIWFLLSIWNQLVFLTAAGKKRSFALPKWDVFALIPVWGFWCNPPATDSVLLYRDKLTDGRLTPWKSAWAMSRNPFRSIWSPQIRKWNAVDNWIPLLLSVAEGKSQPGHCFLSRIYISTAIYISGLQTADPSEFRQFMVARVSGFNSDAPAEILFVSPLFPLEIAHSQSLAS